MATIDYSLSGDFGPTGCNPGQLADEINAAFNATAIVTLVGDVVTVDGGVDITAANIDPLVAAHVNDPKGLGGALLTSVVLSKVHAVTDPNWEDIGGVVSSIGFFVSDIDDPSLRTRVTGLAETTNGAIQLRVVDHSGNQISDVQTIDTNGAEEFFEFWADDYATLGQTAYILQAKKTTANQAWIAYCSFTLILEDIAQ